MSRVFEIILMVFGVWGIIAAILCGLKVLVINPDSKTQKATPKLDTKITKKEEKTISPEDMLLEGWCDDCDCDPAKCINEGRCFGEVIEKDLEVSDNDKNESV